MTPDRWGYIQCERCHVYRPAHAMRDGVCDDWLRCKYPFRQFDFLDGPEVSASLRAREALEDGKKDWGMT